MEAMPASLRIFLLVLSIPAALAGYWATGQLLFATGLDSVGGGLLLVFLPLLGAGLCALPFLVPFFDHLAKQALADAPSRLPQEPEDNTDPSQVTRRRPPGA